MSSDLITYWKDWTSPEKGLHHGGHTHIFLIARALWFYRKAWATSYYETTKAEQLTISSGGNIGSWDGSRGWNSSSSYSLVHISTKHNTTPMERQSYRETHSNIQGWHSSWHPNTKQDIGVTGPPHAEFSCHFQDWGVVSLAHGQDSGLLSCQSWALDVCTGSPVLLYFHEHKGAWGG